MMQAINNDFNDNAVRGGADRHRQGPRTSGGPEQAGCEHRYLWYMYTINADHVQQ